MRIGQLSSLRDQKIALYFVINAGKKNAPKIRIMAPAQDWRNYASNIYQALSKRRLCKEYVGTKVNNAPGLICAEIVQ